MCFFVSTLLYAFMHACGEDLDVARSDDFFFSFLIPAPHNTPGTKNINLLVSTFGRLNLGWEIMKLFWVRISLPPPTTTTPYHHQNHKDTDSKADDVCLSVPPIMKPPANVGVRRCFLLSFVERRAKCSPIFRPR